MKKNRKPMYSEGYVGERILKKVDQLVKPTDVGMWEKSHVYNERPEGYKRIIDDEQQRRANKEYNRLGLMFYYSAEDMKKDLELMNPGFWKTHNLKEFWKDYLKRDELIRVGKYEQAKREIYQENYLAHVEQMTGTDKGLKEVKLNLRKLSDTEFDSLLHPQGDRDKMTSVFPSIQELYDLQGKVNDRGHYEDFVNRVKQAFLENSLNWTTIEPTEKEREEEMAKAKTNRARFKTKLDYDLPSDEYSKTFKRTYKTSKEIVRIRIEEETTIPEDTLTAREMALRALKIKEQELLTSGKSLVYINKKGEYYIPFVRKDIAKDYLKTYYGK